MSSGHAPLITNLRTLLDMLPDPRTIPGAIRFASKEISATASALPNDRDTVLYNSCTKWKSSIDVALREYYFGRRE